MLDGLHASLRIRLREELRPVHDRLDARVGELDLRSRDGYSRFLRMHHVAFNALTRLHGLEGRVKPKMLAAYRAALADDLGALGLAPMEQSLGVPSVSLCASVDHVVLGSRLGTAVLRKQWQRTDDPVVRAAGRYFSIPSDLELWRDHVADLSALPADAPVADDLIRQTKMLFALFEEALDAV